MDFGMPYLLEVPTVEGCCALANELGLSFVELNANFPVCDSQRLDPRELVRLAARYHVYFTFHAEEEFDPFTFNSDVRDAWLKSFVRELRLAAVLGMPIVNMHFPKGVYITLPTEKTYLYERYQDDFTDALADFRRACEKELEGTDTRIAIENTNGWMPWQQQAIEYLLASPFFGLTLDIGHSHAVENADECFFRAHADKLIHMHGHDAQGRKNHLALGDGEIDLRSRFAWARERNSRIVLETKTIEALRTSVQRLPKYL